MFFILTNYYNKHKRMVKKMYNDARLIKSYLDVAASGIDGKLIIIINITVIQ